MKRLRIVLIAVLAFLGSVPCYGLELLETRDFYSIDHLRYWYRFNFRYYQGDILGGSVVRTIIQSPEDEDFGGTEKKVVQRTFVSTEASPDRDELKVIFRGEQVAPFNTPNPRVLSIKIKRELGGMTITVPWSSRVQVPPPPDAEPGHPGETKWVDGECKFYDIDALNTVMKQVVKDQRASRVSEKRRAEMELFEMGLAVITKYFKNRAEKKRMAKNSATSRTKTRTLNMAASYAQDISNQDLKNVALAIAHGDVSYAIDVSGDWNRVARAVVKSDSSWAHNIGSDDLRAVAMAGAKSDPSYASKIRSEDLRRVALAISKRDPSYAVDIDDFDLAALARAGARR